MAIAVDTETLSKSLWSPRATADVPVQENGQLLRVHAARPHDAVFTCAAVSPIDETCYALGTSNGAVYGMSLRDNALFVVARTGLSVRCLSFCGGVAFQTLALALEGNVIVFCDWGTGRVLQRFRTLVHDQPITSIVVSPAAPTCTLLLSADKITCWTPVAASMDTSNYQYTCIGGMSPSQVLYFLLPAAASSSPVSGGGDAPACGRPSSHDAPRFLSVHLFDAYLLTTETNGVVALWSHERRARAGSGAAAVHESMELQCAMRTGDDVATHCSAVCPLYLALGGRRAPVVAIVRHTNHPSYALESQLLIRVSDSAAPGQRRAASSIAASARHVTQLAFIGTELLAVLLSDHRLLFVATRTRTVAFELAFPSPERTPFRSGAGLAPEVIGGYRLSLGGSTFVFAQGETDVYVYHLPSARDHSRRQSLSRALLAGERHNSPSTAICDAAPLDTVKVASFLRQQGQNSVASDKIAHEDVDLERRQLRAAARQAALCSGRDPPQTLEERTTRAWVDANAAEGTQPAAVGGHTAEAARRRQLQQTLNAMYSESLSPQALKYNMDKLRAHVQKHGMFPSSFRPIVWRFALGLPDVHVTAPQYAALARRPPHICLEELMEDFPLPSGAQRRLLEKVLSNLAWHSPVFAMGRFLPALVFPLCHVYPQDPQGITEVVLALFNNWFRDYFSHYPSRPASLLTFLAHVLEKTDGELYHHLETIGAGADTWGWSLLKNFATDLLTAPEWLQVMDHALMLQPMWLFHFHVCLIVALRRPLMACQSASEVQTRVLLQPHPPTVSVPALIAAACEAYHTHRSRSPALRSYYTFRDFGPLFDYPVSFPCDMDVVREKIWHLDELAQVRSIQREADAQLAHDKAVQEDAALGEEIALEAQRVRMAAKYEASADIWRRRVLLEKTREELEARQRALHVLSADNTVRHAEDLQQLEEETVELYRQLGHVRLDQGREEHKWDLAARLTDLELTRLERDARAHVARSLQRLAETDQRQQLVFEDIPRTDDGDCPQDAAVSHPVQETPSRSPPPDFGMANDAAVESQRSSAMTHTATLETPSNVCAGSGSTSKPPTSAVADAGAAQHIADRSEPPTTRSPERPITSASASDAASRNSPMKPFGQPTRTTPSSASASQCVEIPASLPVAPVVSTPPQTTYPPERSMPRVHTPASGLLAPYHAAKQVPGHTAGITRPPSSALQQLYERMKRAAAASVTTSSSAGSSVERANSVGDGHGAATAASLHPAPALYDNLQGSVDARRGLHAHPSRHTDTSTLTTTSFASDTQQTSPSTYSLGQVLEAPRHAQAREYRY